MDSEFECAVSSFQARFSSQSCVDDLATCVNDKAKIGFHLVSSVYDSKREETFLFFERKVKDEEERT